LEPARGAADRGYRWRTATLPPVGLIRLVGMLCLEQNDKRLVGRRYLSADTTIDREEVRELPS
jgi:hypothetical protein